MKLPQLINKFENMKAQIHHIVSGPFSESLIRNHPKTFAEIRRRTVAHIAAKEEVNEKRTCVVPTRLRATGRPQTLRVHEATTEKKTLVKQQPYQPRKPQTRVRERENVPPRHNFMVELKDLIVIPNVAERLKVPPPPKSTRGSGPTRIPGVSSTKHSTTTYATA